MNGRIRGRPARPRSRFLLVEHLEDRFLLSTAGPVAPISLASLPTAGPPGPALVTGPSTPAPDGPWHDPWLGQQAAHDSISTGPLLGPAGPGFDGDHLFLATPGSLGPSPGGSPLADNSSLMALASTTESYHPWDGEHGTWAADQALPSLFGGQDPFAAAPSAVEADRLHFALASPLVSAPGVNLFTDHLSLPSGGQVLGTPWPSHELFTPWAEVRLEIRLTVMEDLAGTEVLAPGNVPPVNPGSDPSLTYEATAAVAPALDAGSARGPVSRPVTADTAVHLPLLAALAGTEATLEKVSAEAPRQAAAAAGDPGRPAVSSPAHLTAAPGAALADPGAGLPAPGAKALSPDSAGDAGLPPAGKAPVTVRGKVALPATGGGTGGGAGPAEDGPEAPVSQPGDGLDLASLPSRAAALLESGLPFDVPALTHGVDAFFARLGALGQGRDGVPGYARFVPWVIVLSAAALELARRRQAQPSALVAGEEDLLPGRAGFLTEEDQ